MSEREERKKITWNKPFPRWWRRRRNDLRHCL